MKKVFVDSDVIISSLLSTKGAAYFLLNEQKDKFTISNISKKELEKVADRLGINQEKLHNLIQKKFKSVKLTTDLTKIKRDFQHYRDEIINILDTKKQHLHQPLFTGEVVRQSPVTDKEKELLQQKIKK